MFIFLIAIHVIANSAAKLLTRVFSQNTKLDPYTASLAIMAPAYLSGAAFGFTKIDQPLLQGFTPTLLALILGVGLFQVISGKVSMITQKHIEVAPYAVMRALYLPVSILLSMLFIGESLTTQQLIGMVSIFIGVCIVSTGGKFDQISRLGKYELLTIVNSMFLGGYIVFMNYVIDQTSLAATLIVLGGIETIPLLMTVAARPKQKPSRTDLKLTVGIGLCMMAGNVAFWLAVANINNLALVSSVSAFRIVTIALGGYIFLNERADIKQKILGSILATIGLILS